MKLLVEKGPICSAQRVSCSSPRANRAGDLCSTCSGACLLYRTTMFNSQSHNQLTIMSCRSMQIRQEEFTPSPQVRLNLPSVLHHGPRNCFTSRPGCVRLVEYAREAYGPPSPPCEQPHGVHKDITQPLGTLQMHILRRERWHMALRRVRSAKQAELLSA